MSEEMKAMLVEASRLITAANKLAYGCATMPNIDREDLYELANAARDILTPYGE